MKNILKSNISQTFNLGEQKRTVKEENWSHLKREKMYLKQTQSNFLFRGTKEKL